MMMMYVITLSLLCKSATYFHLRIRAPPLISICVDISQKFQQPHLSSRGKLPSNSIKDLLYNQGLESGFWTAVCYSQDSISIRHQDHHCAQVPSK